MKQNRNLWVYDIETLKSCFTYTGLNVDTQEVVQFVLHEKVNNLDSLINHLNTCKGQIGFNNVNFDYPIIHRLMNNYKNGYFKSIPASDIVRLIYDDAQRLIEEQNLKTGFNSIISIPLSDVLIPQLDLYKVWHYNNKARSTSLKALEISMNFPNVMEMSIQHDHENIPYEAIESILEYNLNDVYATYEFYKRSIEKVKLRKSISEKFNIPCINWSDSKIGEQLILKLYCDKTGYRPWEIKKLRSNRSEIALKDIVLPYISFQSKEFNELLDYFNNKIIFETKGSISKSVIYKGFKYDYGTGGIHGCIKSGIYESDNDYIIIDADVASLYPNLAIKNKFYIEHLGESFIDVYQSIVNLRLQAKKEGDMVLSDGFKLAANSVYG